MRKAVKYLLILAAVFLTGLMFYASVTKIQVMSTVRANPELFNQRSIEYHYRHHQLLSYLHIIAGMFFLLTGAYQLIPHLRKRYRRVHRVVGRLFLATSGVVAITALVMALFFPFGDSIETATTLVYGSFLLVGTYFVYAAARKRAFSRHKAWVLRVYFVALSIASIRIVAAVGMALTGTSLKEMLGISFAIAFTLHLLVVESWMRFAQTR